MNAERDVFLYVVEGAGTLFQDGVERPLAQGDALVIEKGRSRRIVGGPEGIRYITVHRRRGGLQISPAPSV